MPDRAQPALFLLLMLVATTTHAAPWDLSISPQPAFESEPLRFRLEGPFQQPAPSLWIRVEAGRIVVQSYSEDYVFPNMPPVPEVIAEIGAPAAGVYSVVHLSCDGFPPPSSPPCIAAQRGTIEVLEVVSIPAAGTAPLLALCLALLGLGGRAMHRRRAAVNASTAP